MTESETRIGIAFNTKAEADAFAADLQAQGASTQIEEHPHILPAAILLWVVVPPAIGLLAYVGNRIAKTWFDHGTLIDARGTGVPVVVKQDGLPYGTVVILTRDGDKSQRTDLPDEDSVSEYISKALSAVVQGDSASGADDKAKPKDDTKAPTSAS